ncbi:MAG TPA: GHKL domain-containing protein [Candidatus Eisenbergiella merdipullorum]|uniref:GHKL domain-containing protein n=1 Tax=Candidatus Eisenbergiella merdipullorum TaxID=2838553 RepID=A0A9D2L1S6_9FIRM|nr:GHKL domain-containing protein [Candidatus Eisenbergiella merdipullorum]
MSLEIYNSIIALLANALRFYALRHFVCIFAPKETCRWKYVFPLYLAGWGCTSLVGLWFSSPAMNIMANVASLFIIFLPYPLKRARKCLAVFIIYVINALVDSVVILSLSTYVAGESVNQVYECITSFLLLFIAMILERTARTEEETELPLSNMAALLMVPVISILYIYYLVITVSEKKTMVIFAAFTLLFINILIFYLYHSLLRFYSSRMNEQVFEQMLEVYSYQLDIVRESEERMKALRHDMKHHLMELSALARKGSNDEMTAYLNEMQEFMLNPKEYASSGNREIDGVLNYLLRKANTVLNQVDVQMNIPENMYLNNFDICVILGNLVDNAVREAGKSEEKRLAVKIQVRQEILFIFVENSYQGKLIEKGGALHTTQKDPAIHGIGLENVKKVVAANGGEIKIEYTENTFYVHVLLYLSHIKA